MKQEFYTVSEAAEALGVSEITVKRYIYAGRLRSSKLPGGQHRIACAEIERLLSGAQTQEPPSAEAVIRGLEQRVEELEATLEQVTGELRVLAAWCSARAQELPARERAEPRHTIQVLGPGCRRCRELFRTVEGLIQRRYPGQCSVEMVGDLDRIVEYGPVLTPALVVDGTLVPLGRTPGGEELEHVLERHLARSEG